MKRHKRSKRVTRTVTTQKWKRLRTKVWHEQSISERRKKGEPPRQVHCL